MTTEATDQVQGAQAQILRAIDAMYAEYEEIGGPSPSAGDVVSHALTVCPRYDSDDRRMIALGDVVYEMRCWAASNETVAAFLAEALSAGGQG